ncbi:MAG TPA: SMI1/KNR4 family protein [Candidatus Eisenbacteria bacterium]|nr:SMI1/KNR4 family protein [Candidatus Eisenbacteria bacterium]
MNWKQAIGEMALIHQHIWDLDDARIWPRHLPEVAASEKEIKAVEASLGYELPSDYRSFLACADGWRGFYQWVDLFGSKELNGSARRSAEITVATLEKEGALPKERVSSADVLPVALSSKDIDLFVLVKPNHPRAGSVIWLAGTVVDRFPSFAEFFLAMMDYNREEVQELLKARSARGLS